MFEAAPIGMIVRDLDGKLLSTNPAFEQMVGYSSEELVDILLRRIESASRFVPLDQLAISPQCGFSSTVHGNEIDRAAQAAKLRLVVDVAAQVWSA